MGESSERFRRAIDAIDAANSEDPNRESRDGEAVPKELYYARRMTAWLEKLTPGASESLRLAARAQHIRRWTIPRSDYPPGKKGYYAWRTTLYGFHAREAAAILRAQGYDDRTIERVEALLRKKDLRSDAEMQTLEDVACLVFLESYFADFSRLHEEEKIITILRKTWRKMSERGRAAALTLDLTPEARALVEKALNA